MKEKKIEDTSIVVDLHLLQLYLEQIPLKLEEYAQCQRVYKKSELNEVLKEKFSIKNPDKSMLLYFLIKLKFLSKLSANGHVFYVLGTVASAKEKEYLVDLKMTELGREDMIQKKVDLMEEIKDSVIKIRQVTDASEIRAMKIDCIAKAGIVDRLSKHADIIEEKIKTLKAQGVPLNKENKNDLGNEAETWNVENTILEIENNLTMSKDIQEKKSLIFENVKEEAKEGMIDHLFAELLKSKKKSLNVEKISGKSKDKVQSDEYSFGEKVIKSQQSKNNREEKGTQKQKPKFSEDEELKNYTKEVNESKVICKVIYKNNRVLKFNHKQKGLRGENKTGKSFGDFQKQKLQNEKKKSVPPPSKNDHEVMDFSGTFKGTNKQSSSGRGLSEFTINKTVSNLDAKVDNKYKNKSTVELKQNKYESFANRNALSQEKEQSKVGFFKKLKDKIFGFERKKRPCPKKRVFVLIIIS